MKKIIILLLFPILLKAQMLTLFSDDAEQVKVYSVSLNGVDEIVYRTVVTTFDQTEIGSEDLSVTGYFKSDSLYNEQYIFMLGRWGSGTDELGVLISASPFKLRAQLRDNTTSYYANANPSLGVGGNAMAANTWYYYEIFVKKSTDELICSLYDVNKSFIIADTTDISAIVDMTYSQGTTDDLCIGGARYYSGSTYGLFFGEIGVTEFALSNGSNSKYEWKPNERNIDSGNSSNDLTFYNVE